jgi:cytochrome c-type biogenesis protein CcmH
MIILWPILITILLIFLFAIFFGSKINSTERIQQNMQAIFTAIKTNSVHGLIIGGISLIAILIYAMTGAGGQLKNYQHIVEQNKMAVALEAQMQNPDAIVKKMKETLVQHPNSQEGWYLLGRLYFTQGKFHLAAESFAKAYALVPNNHDVIVQYVQALYFANHQQLTPKTKKLLAEIQVTQPKDPAVNHLLAIAAFHQHDYEEAILHWQIVLEVLPIDDPERETVVKAIEQAREHLTLAELTKLKQHQHELDHHQLTVHVQLDPSHRSSFAPTDSVFIVVKAVDGPTIPLAVVRKKVSDFPIEVTLTYHNAMSPLYNLDQFNRVRVIVKITVPGTNVTADGLASAQTQPIDLRQQETATLLVK